MEWQSIKFLNILILIFTLQTICVLICAVFSFFYQRPFTDITSCHSGKCIIAVPLSTHIIRISLSLFYTFFNVSLKYDPNIHKLLSTEAKYYNDYLILNLNIEIGNLLLKLL
jgi:hypothetical protein